MKVFLSSILVLLFCLNFNLEAANNKKPNIIYILADDLGYGDLGCYGSTKIKTPSLDRMAAEGMRFTNHYCGQPVCSPSRCSLMTGMHMGHATVKGNGQYLVAEDVTVAELLKEAGYSTGAIGKWGLSKGVKAPSAPNQQGFDYWFGFENQGFAHFYYPEYLWRNHTKVEYPENLNIRDENGHYIEGKGTYSHDEFAKDALQFIKKNKNNPFFLYLPFAIPHAELTVPEDSRKQYEDLGWPEKPKKVGGGGRKNDAGYGSQYKDGYCAQEKPNMTYAAMISRMDRNIGRILDLLDELDIAENTIVMFSSDNGPSGEGGQNVKFFNSSGGLRGSKRQVYEGGIRVPFVVRWKGVIEAGQESRLPSAFYDFLPTACDIAGIEAPGNIDGISMLPTFFGNNNEQKKHKYLYWEWRNLQAIRSGKWKFFYMNSKKPDEDPIYELYDLEKDRSEQENLVTKYPKLISKFLSYLKEAKE